MAGDKENPSEEINSQKSWEIARAYAAKVGEIPAAFTSSIRMLLVDQVKNNKKISVGNQTQTALLLNSPSFKAMFYFAVKTFRDDELAAVTKVTRRTLPSLFEPLDLACIMGISFLFRRCRKKAAPDLFDPLVERTQRDVNIGGYLGDAIPKIGLGYGILVGGIRYLSEAAFMLHDPEGYRRYHNVREKKGVRFDLDLEVSRWGCTSLQVGSVLLQTLGFGIEFAESFVYGLDPRISDEATTDPNVYRVKISDIWITSLATEGSAPNITHRGAYYPLENDLETLLKLIQIEPLRGRPEAWLTKSKDELNENSAPELFGAKRPQEEEDLDSGAMEEVVAALEE
ncbi:MAG: hypothetical protein KDD64_10665 [Bdellovibrionales bacterium]|nr:hypothetical protein [Bdellovibrionales bacterium]